MPALAAMRILWRSVPGAAKWLVAGALIQALIVFSAISYGKKIERASALEGRISNIETAREIEDETEGLPANDLGSIIDRLLGGDE